MKVYFHPEFYDKYSTDPAAETGRMEAIIEEITPFAEIISCAPASEDDLLAAHTKAHIEQVRRMGLF